MVEDKKKQDTHAGFHLSVMPDGTVSLWDTLVEAQDVREETYLLFPLTDTQRTLLAEAQRKAIQKAKHALDTPQVGCSIDLSGYHELAHLSSVSDETCDAKIVHNHSTHILVATLQMGGSPNGWRLAASFPYGTTAFEVAYVEALRFACLAVGAVVMREVIRDEAI